MRYNSLLRLALLLLWWQLQFDILSIKEHDDDDYMNY